MKLAVIGGGIAGLSAAWEARDRAEVTLYEPGRLGGKILTTEFDGHAVDCGPDAFVTRSSAAIDLCAELGLSGELVAPAAGRTLLWWQGKLRPLPEGLMLGVPRRVGPLVRSGLLSPLGLLRAGADLVLPRRSLGDDCSVFDLVAGRFGPEVAARLVDPLVGGIHAGRTEELSAAATVPQILAAARQSRSLLLGLRSAPDASAGVPLFLAPRGGMVTLVDAMVAGLTAAGVKFVSSQVTSLRQAGTGVTVDPGGEHYDAAVVATPAAEAARILGSAAPAGVAQIRTASVVLVTLAYRNLPTPDGVNGILVPRREGHLMTACSFGSAKWPHWSSPGTTVVRISTGRSGDSRATELDDSSLITRLADELSSALGLTASPFASRISRWPDSFPQYEVGHLARVDTIEASLRRQLPRVALAGASYRGAGIPACVVSGKDATVRSLG